MKFDETVFSPKSLTPVQQPSSPPKIMQPEIQAAPEIGFQVLERNLENCLQLIDEEVMKSYIPELSKLPIVEPDINISEFEKEPFQFFRITRLVYEKDEFSISKLTAVFQTISNTNSTLVLMIHNHHNTAEFYLGVRNHDTANRTGEMRQMLEMSLNGQFPGSSVSRASIEEIRELTKNNKLHTESISCVTCVADYKQQKESHENKDFLQGLEKFIISMQSKDYTAIFIAETVSRIVLDERRKELEQIYSQLSPFANMQFQYGSSTGHSDGNTQNTGRTYTTTDGISNTQGITDSLSFSKAEGTTNTETDSTTHTKNQSKAHGISKGTTETNTTGHSTADGTSHTVTDTKSISGTFGGSFNMGTFSSVGNAVNVGLNILGVALGGGGNTASGVNSGFGINGSMTTGRSHGVSNGTSHTETNSYSHSSSLANTISNTLTEGLSDSSTTGQSHGITHSATDTVSRALSLQKGQNHSFSEAISIGQSDSTTETTGVTQGIMMQYKNMTLNNMLQRIEMQIKRLNECESLGMWNCAAYFLGTSRSISETAANAYYSLVAGEHSGIERSGVNTWQNPQDVSKLEAYISNFSHPVFEYYRKKDHSLQKINPSVLVSTKELAIQYSFPKKSVCGLPVAEHAVFGQQIIKKHKESLSSASEEQKAITIGSIYHLDDTLPTKVTLNLDSLCMHTLVSGSTGSGKSNVVYDILEQLYEKKIPYLVIEPAKGEYKECIPADYVYGTNPTKGELLQLDPFSFPSGIHVQEHIDKLTEIFNVCWPMYAAMPAILKKAIIRSYEAVGWDMLYSKNFAKNDLFPTFEEVCRQLEEVMQSTEYSSDTGNDYRGALKTRVSSLTDGINGIIFSHQEVNNARLFNANTIVDLSRVGSPETKSLIMGILILKLQEYHISENKSINQHFRHMTVLEEAHHLLKRTSMEQSQESANLMGKSVEMLTNAIAEMRTYGEGFLIADQSPSMLDTAAIRNTNTKIVLRLPEEQDRNSVGKSIVLDEKQIQELSKLPTGVAAVYQNDWQEAVLCDIVLHTPRSLEFRKTKNQKFTELLKILLHGVADKTVVALIQTTGFSNAVQQELLSCLQDRSDTNLINTLGQFITTAFHWEHIFYRTSETCTTIEEVTSVIIENLQQMFPTFSADELFLTAYYICSYQYQLNPENNVLKLVSQQCFLKKEVN